MAYFKPLPKPKPDPELITHLARAVGIIKPYQYIQYSRTRMFAMGCVSYYHEVEAWDGIDTKRIMGMYIRKSGQRRDGSEPPIDANEGDIVEYVERCYDD